MVEGERPGEKLKQASLESRLGAEGSGRWRRAKKPRPESHGALERPGGNKRPGDSNTGICGFRAEGISKWPLRQMAIEVNG